MANDEPREQEREEPKGGGGRGRGGGMFRRFRKTSEDREPTADSSSWVRPVHAVVVVGLVGLMLVGVVVAALLVLLHGPDTQADPNTETIAAIATAGISALSSLAAAYFGIRVASEGAAQATATARRALDVTENVSRDRNSSGQRPPRDDEF